LVDIDVKRLADRVGEEVAVSEWFEISQERINQFADATGDHQWIHVDPVRAAAESPFKTTIAHGFLTLSLVPILVRQAMTIDNIRLAVNYGSNRLRFVAPVPSGSRVRGRFTVGAVEEIGGGVQVTWNLIIERDGGDKPCVVAEWLVRYYPQ
jgi:acyl dehydratase